MKIVFGATMVPSIDLGCALPLSVVERLLSGLVSLVNIPQSLVAMCTWTLTTIHTSTLPTVRSPCLRVLLRHLP